ncbi:alpha/beta fold hydrolase [Arthrobacter sp. CAN_C5]|uniref:alpha/beta fold hydrolase n=1 Tax=Arthrobacter sp. CAN_C5 TaxID=2760706 RepID=UPI001AE54217|nr:alpha/beta hydrolase [Arthrobacter sp. CAN_C5]MBP2215605.1 pimeloyl-ACP methyl ester carboxylesterase [Arthrobacter sp. CAN_C5]
MKEVAVGRTMWEHSQTVVVGEVSCAVRTVGAGSREVILIHGIGVSARYFEPMAAHLARTCTVRAIELPGFAALPAPRRRLTVKEFGGIAAEVMRVLGVRDAVVVGHSMGSQVAAEAVRAAPDLVSSLVLLAPTINDRERTVATQMMRLAQDTLRESPAANYIVVSDYFRAGMRWYLKTLPSMLRHRLEDALPTITCPVTLVRGSRDPIVPADWMHRLAEAGNDVTTGEVPGEPHVMMYRSPEATARFFSGETSHAAR